MSKEQNSKQMSLLEDSHVNHSVLPENKKEQTTTAISGQKCLDSLKRSNQNSFLARMSRELLTSKTAWYSDRCSTTWKVKTSKSNVTLFQLQASVHGIKEKESGLLDTQKQMDYSKQNMYPTPQLDDGKNVNPGPKRRMTLAKHVKMYPTPTTQEIEHPNMVLNEKGRRMPVKGKTDHSLNLADTVRMYPTPTSVQRPNEGNMRMMRKQVLQGLISREEASAMVGKDVFKAHGKVKMYPTPTVDCEEGGQQSERVERTKSGAFILRKKNKPESTFGAKLSDAMLYLEEKRGGKLNPTFVEFLMGFPMNWTKTEPVESKPLEMQSSHKSQESLDLPSKKFYRTPTAMDKGDNSFKYAAKILKGKTNRAQSKKPVQKTLSMDVAMEH